MKGKFRPMGGGGKTKGSAVDQSEMSIAGWGKEKGRTGHI